MGKAIALIVLLLAGPLFAQVELTLPLEGYWRPGRYMPVRVQAKVGGNMLEIGAQGAVPVRLPLVDGRADAIVPMLIMSEPRGLYWNAGGGGGGLVEKQFRRLGPEQRLVGFTSIDLDIARRLFPEDPIVPIQLASADPLPGPVVAWEMLDALVLDASPSDEKLRELNACGVQVVVRGRPTTRPTLMVGPSGAAEDLAAFAPVQGWQADWPVAFRRGIVLSALLYSILGLGLGLMRFKYTAIGLLIFCGIATAGLWWWWRDRPAVLVKFGVIVCRHETGTAQIDSWTYYGTASGSDALMPWSQMTYPYFESREDRLAMKPLLMCREDGTPQQFNFRLLAGQKIGFLMRSFSPMRPATLSQEISSPMQHLAKWLYLREGVKIAGEGDFPLPDAMLNYGEQWPTLVIETQGE